MASVGFTPPPGNGVGVGAAAHGFVITPGASALPFITRKIWVGGLGNLVVQLAGDSASVTLTAVPAGTMLDLCASFVLSGTTATNLIGLY